MSCEGPEEIEYGLFMCALVPSKVKVELWSVRVLKERRKYKHWSGPNSSQFLCADLISRVGYSEVTILTRPAGSDLYDRLYSMLLQKTSRLARSLTLFQK